MNALITIFKKYAPVYGVILAMGFLIYYCRPKVPSNKFYYLLIGYMVFAVIVAFILHIIDKRSVGSKKGSNQEGLHYYKPTEGLRYNSKFYDHLHENIEKSQSQIVMIGDGFGCDTKESKDRAEEYIETYRKVLKKGIHVLRVQFQSKSHPHWAKLLGRLVDDFQDDFELYILNDESTWSNSPVMIVIDPELEGKNSSFIVYTSDKSMGVKKQSLASFAFVLEDDIAFSKEIDKRVVNLAKPCNSTRINSTMEAMSILCPEDNVVNSCGN